MTLLSLKTDYIRVLYSLETKEVVVVSLEEMRDMQCRQPELYDRLDCSICTDVSRKPTIKEFQRELVFPLMVGVPFYKMHDQCLRVKEYRDLHSWEFGGPIPDGTFDGCYRENFQQWVKFNDPSNKIDEDIEPGSGG
jgi:hypothetical protein